MFPGIFASPSSVLDYIMRIASCLLSNGEQVSPKKARLSDIRSLGCLFSFGVLQRRTSQTGLVSKHGGHRLLFAVAAFQGLKQSESLTLRHRALMSRDARAGHE